MSSIIDNKLIFSNEKKYRIGRHLLFWGCYWLYFGFLHAANSFGAKEIMYFNNLPYTLTESFLSLIPQVMMAYPMLYFILPKLLLEKKYLLGFFAMVILVIIGGAISLYMVRDVNQNIIAWLMPERFRRIPQRPPNVTFFMGLLVNMKGGLLGMFGAVGIKLMKHFYLKEHRNLQLQKENAESQLKLLTAQVHPHFLFNTLNNIYSQTQTESPKGSKMIMELSDMLRYILAEGNKAKVPLQKELAMIQDYMNLEKIRYGNKLDLHVSVTGETNNLQIAPLLLLPFVENCFKHGASKFLSAPWINLTIEMNNNILLMKLMNGKDNEHDDPATKSGTGLNNVKKRMELLYAGKYELQITDEPEVFVANLKLELQTGKQQDDTVETTQPTPYYA